MATASADRRRSALPALRVALALFVVAWIFDVLSLRSAVPIWLPFLVALALELHFFAGARRREPARSSPSDRMPQAVDRERYGFREEPDDLLLVRQGDEELWIPYSGEREEELEELVADARERDDDAPEEATFEDPTEPRRRPVGQLLVGAGVIAALAVLVWVVDTRSGWSGLDAGTKADAEARFSSEASRIAGHRVTIRCDEAGEHVGWVQHADGVAEVGGRLAYLTPDRCNELYRLAYEGDISSGTPRALAVLAHEAWHLRGVRDEGETECYALQSGVELGRRLGLSDDDARQMMRQQLAENSLRRGAGTEYVVPPECRDGGSLDLDAGDSEFP